MIRAKMRCSALEASDHADAVRFDAVYSDDPTQENHAWSQATPSGQLSLYISNPGARGKFEVGKEYFVDIAPAD